MVQLDRPVAPVPDVHPGRARNWRNRTQADEEPAPIERDRSPRH